MAIPDYQSMMQPILAVAVDGRPYPVADLVAAMEDHFRLTPDERTALLPSGTQRTIANRVQWAVSYLSHAGLLDRVARGQVSITDRGRQLVNTGVARVDVKVLAQYPEFQEFRTRSAKRRPDKPGTVDVVAVTPDEAMDATYQTYREGIEADLLERVLASSPEFFERLVLQLLRRMGYGDANPGKADQHVGGPGDGGIDGIIFEDRLGLDAVYVQAKRWAPDNPVRRPDLQAFAGSLEGHRATKGVFITTSRFTDDARQYLNQISKRVVPIDGRALVRLMYDHGVGVRTVATYELRRVDSGAFEE